MAITGGPPAGGDTRDKYGFSADEAAAHVARGYEFFGLTRLKGNEGKPMSVEGAMNTFIRYATGTPQQRATFAQIQNLLYLGGFYSSKSYVPTYGGFRLEDQAAFKKALLSASAGKGPGKIALSDYFAGMANAYQAYNVKAPKGPKAPVLTVQYTDPTDIRRVVERTAPDVLGRDLSDDEKGRIVDLYHQLEGDAQRKAFNAQTGSGGSYVAPPDLGAFAADEARKLHPDEADTYGKFNLVNDTMKLLGIGQGGNGNG